MQHNEINIKQLLAETAQSVVDVQNIRETLPARPSRLKLMGQLAPVLNNLVLVRAYLQEVQNENNRIVESHSTAAQPINLFANGERI